MAAAGFRKPQTIDRHAFPRRPYLPAVPPPDAEALQPPDDDASGGGCRRACRNWHLSVRDSALCHQERTDELVSGGQRPLPLPDLPRRGHHPGHAVRQIHCARQHLRRGDPRALRHVEPQLAAAWPASTTRTPRCCSAAAPAPYWPPSSRPRSRAWSSCWRS